jgi:predicted ATP-grasp superfamily ATP-dependent carboligase
VRVFIYEYLTGGGIGHGGLQTAPCDSLLREGAAMIRALTVDFAQIDGVEVVALRDRRQSDLRLPDCRIVEVGDADEERTAIATWAARADWTVLIAPEFDGILFDRCRQVEKAAGRLLSPNTAFVQLASDKHRASLTLAEAGISVPHAILLNSGEPLPTSFPYPAIIKPLDGAGSLGVQLIPNDRADFDRSDLGNLARLERFCPGIAASVAVLCGPGQTIPLPACRQWLSDDGRFQYLGGQLPLPESFSQRAQQLAVSAVRALPHTIGYVGVDLVLGDTVDGTQDVVIEVNPRLTTSYVGLRKLSQVNLAQAMLDIAQGKNFTLSFSPHPLKFSADGTVSDL